jgi:hypothetical protein
MISNATILSACVWLALFSLWPGIRLQAQSPYTPKVGSPERQAICDAMRAYVQTAYAQKKLPKPVVFKIDTLRVQGDFAYIECLPQFKDGSQAVPDHLPDIAYSHCLQREAKGWKVILDLSRTDVPDDTEIRQIRSRIPSAFPHSILSVFWRDLFKKAG